MSILVREPKRARVEIAPQVDEKSARITETRRYRPYTPEAPDAGEAGREAPETSGRPSEAPEARMCVWETPIYHGRSRS
ncbi:MAG: hypothetical protein SFX72_02750 [Isosphaeraceae bacterium]|nr:hypothetical protein [Isosphaeraceae bacterium]